MNNQNYAQVLHDFEANFADELDAKSGDFIQIISKIDNDWVYGKCLTKNQNQTGIIPLSYLKQIEIPDYLINNEQSPKLILFTSKADFFKIEKDDLDFVKGELIIGEKKLDENWMFGYYLLDNSKRGIFPLTHVKQIELIKETKIENIKDKIIKNTIPKQVKCIKKIKGSDLENCLEIDEGDYLLVTGKIDDNWLYVENFNGQKGLIPSDSVEYIQNAEVEPILNRTQRKYTITNDESFINDQSLSDNSFKIEDDLKKENESFKSIYCIVNYDFTPENNNELGCITGEHLKIDKFVNQDWIKCINQYGKIGIVPVNFVTLFNEKETFKIEKNFQKPIEVKKNLLNDLVLNEIKSMSPIKQNEKSSSNFNLSNVTKNDKLRSKSLTPELMNDRIINELKSKIEKQNGYKPPIPPKPKRFSTQINNFNNQTAYRASILNSNENKNINNLIEFDANNKESNYSTIHNISEYNNNENSLLDSNIILIKDSNEYEETKNEIKTPQNLTKTNSFKKKRDRTNVINELIETEKNYYTEMLACYECFILTTHKCPNEFNKNQLFEKLKPVLELSKGLIDLFDLELSRNENDLEKCRIGKCLTHFKDEMRIVYAQYTRNHNEITSLIKRYEANPVINEYINERLATIKDKLSVLELSTILIKPVQRIFKYPLFLDRIKSNTNENHLDYENVINAQKEFLSMLNYINEYKRRQDLVTKYLNKPSLTEQTDLSFIDLMKKINLRTIKKKSGRLSLQLSNVLGWYNPHVYDEKFNQVETSFRSVEKASRDFFNDLNSFLSILRELLDFENIIFRDLLIIFDDDFKTYYTFEESSNQRRSTKFQAYASKLINQVLNPVKGLLKCLNGPNKLINKRYHKLLDYENSLIDLEQNSANLKENQSKVDIAKKDYEALNAQLIEELPDLIQKTSKFLSKTIELFIFLTNEFLKIIKESFRQDVEKGHIDLCFSNDSRQSTLTLTLNQINSKFNRQTTLYSSSYDQIPYSIIPTQNEQQRQKVINKYPTDKLYVITQNYIANEKLCQLKQNINDLVGLLKPYDPAGQKHIWFVDNGDVNGFIPCDALKPYLEVNKVNNLIDFEDDLTKVETASGSNLESILEEKFCIANYNFKSPASNTINLVEGEIYKVIEMCDQRGDSQWWLVELNDKIGYVPSSYVKLLD